MPDAAWTVNGYPPGSSQGRYATLVPTSSHCVSTRQRQRTLVHRSSSRPAPDAIEPRLFPRRSAQRSSASAPVAGLKPPPVGRLQRAKQPLSLLQHRIQRDHHLPIRPASCVRVHNISSVAPHSAEPPAPNRSTSCVRVHNCSMPVYPGAFPTYHPGSARGRAGPASVVTRARKRISPGRGHTNPRRAVERPCCAAGFPAAPRGLLALCQYRAAGTITTGDSRLAKVGEEPSTASKTY